MSADHTYNGWRNYATWATNLWISNDPGTYEAGMEAAQRGREALKAWVEDWVTGDSASLGADLLGWALGEIDWDELIAALTEES